VLYKRGIPSAAISYLKEAVANSDGDIAVSGISMHHLAQAYEADGNPAVRPEPAWAAEVRTMLARLERGG